MHGKFNTVPVFLIVPLRSLPNPGPVTLLKEEVTIKMMTGFMGWKLSWSFFCLVYFYERERKWNQVANETNDLPGMPRHWYGVARRQVVKIIIIIIVKCLSCYFYYSCLLLITEKNNFRYERKGNKLRKWSQITLKKPAGSLQKKLLLATPLQLSVMRWVAQKFWVFLEIWKVDVGDIWLEMIKV